MTALLPHAGHIVTIREDGTLHCLSCMTAIEFVPKPAEEPSAVGKLCAFCEKRPATGDGDGDLCTECFADDNVQWCEGCEAWTNVEAVGSCGVCECCDDCCNCATCAHCDERVGSTCDNCERCGDCCPCAFCDGCEQNVKSTCDGCNRCEDCGCNCESDEEES